jgi:hypothetical protein
MQPSKCHDKIPFKTKEEAEGAITLAKYRYGQKPLIAYLCAHCQMWHIAQKRDDE